MDSLVEPGISIILAIQSLGAWLAVPMQFFSFLGSEEFFLLVLPIIYWMVSTELGTRIGFILLFTGGVNNVFKLVFHGPRPYWVSTNVLPGAAETSFGVPSGHAQLAMGVWGISAHWISKTWAWVTAAFIIFFIGFSRMYLGVHFLHDVLLGWAIGGLVLALFIIYWKPLEDWLKTLSLTQQVGVAFGVSVAIIVFASISLGAWSSWIIPAEWLENASAAFPDELPNPHTLDGALTPAGALFGLAAGVAWLRQKGGFDVSGPFWKRAIRYVVGIIGVLVIWSGLGAVFPRGDELLPYILRYVRYTLLGLWIAALAPMLFIRFGLANKKSK